MSDDLLADEKRMRLRYAGTCRVCDVDLPARVEAIYERSVETPPALAVAPRSTNNAAVLRVSPALQRPGEPGVEAVTQRCRGATGLRRI